MNFALVGPRTVIMHSDCDLLPLETTSDTELILNIICCFSRIDFDLVSPCVTSVLPVVAKVNPRIHVYERLNPLNNCFSALFFIESSGRISRAWA